MTKVKYYYYYVLTVLWVIWRWRELSSLKRSFEEQTWEVTFIFLKFYIQMIAYSKSRHVPLKKDK